MLELISTALFYSMPFCIREMAVYKSIVLFNLVFFVIFLVLRMQVWENQVPFRFHL